MIRVCTRRKLGLKMKLMTLSVRNTWLDSRFFYVPTYSTYVRSRLFYHLPGTGLHRGIDLSGIVYLHVWCVYVTYTRIVVEPINYLKIDWK